MHDNFLCLIQEWRQNWEKWTPNLHQNGQYWSCWRTVSAAKLPPVVARVCFYCCFVDFKPNLFLLLLFLLNWRHPSLEEVLSWARSFELMLRSLEGREIFQEFLRSEYSEDNLLFWMACEELKKETIPSVVDEKARIIYEDYVSILSPKEVRCHKTRAFRVIKLPNW